MSEKTNRAGLDFVHWELIGWLWIPIGGSHVIGISNSELRKDTVEKGGEVILIKKYN